MFFRYFILLFFFVPSLQCVAQTKQTQQVGQTWVGYLNQTRLSKHWGFWAEAQQRTKENVVEGASQTLLRFGLTHYFNDNTKLTAGYAFINNYPIASVTINQAEHRPWQQIQWHTKYGKNRTMQWFRLEERYRRKLLNDSTLASGYHFNFRMRYNFLFQIPLSKKGIVPKSTSFIVNDEVHVNFGKQIVYNYFDQNRFFVGLAYQTNKTDNLQFGYMNLFQQLASGNRYRSTHTLRIFYFHNVDWRK
jgi:hypothetical protein